MRSSTTALLLLLAAWSGASWAADPDPDLDSDSLCQRSRASGQPVIVVGTGFSGIAAALALQEHNCTALLLEARDRVGGRTHSLEGGVFDGQDEGAHWVEGNSPKRNPIKKMIVEHGLAYTRVSRHPVGGTEANFHEVAIYDEQGRRFSIAEKRQAFLFFARQCRKVRAIYLHRVRRGLPDMSIAQAFEEASAGLSEEESRLSTFFSHWYMGLDDASDLREDSLFQWFEDDNYDWLYDVSDPNGDGSDVLLGGYGALVSALVDDLGGDPSVEIRLNSAVTEIAVGDDGVVLTTADGIEVQGAGVILTAPLGVLQEGVVKFTPPLSDAKTAAIGALNMGLENHYYVAYNNEAPQRTCVDGDYSTGFFNVSDPGKVLPSWFNGQVEEDGSCIMNAMAHGAWAQGSEQLSSASVAASAGAIAQTMWGAESAVPESFYMSKWHADEWARGSYSYAAVNSTKADRDAFVPAAWSTSDGPASSTVPLEQLLFAGEHTCACLYATVPGAFVSGLRAAFVAIGPEASSSTWEYFDRRFLNLCDVFMEEEASSYFHDEDTEEERLSRVLEAGVQTAWRGRRRAAAKARG